MELLIALLIITLINIAVLTITITACFLTIKNYKEHKEKIDINDIPVEYDEVYPDDPIEEYIKSVFKNFQKEDIFKTPNAPIYYNVELSNIDFFKEEITSCLKESLDKQDFTRSASLRDLKHDCEKWFNKRKQWFLSNIGKNVFLKGSECNCELCEELENNGVLIRSKAQALSMFGTENENKIRGNNIMFYVK